MSHTLKTNVSAVDRARRRFLIASLAALLAGTGPFGHCLGSQKREPPAEPPWWLRMAGDRDAVLRFGDAYLRSHPEENALETLVAKIEEAMATDGDFETAQTREAAYAVTFERQVRRDYQAGAVVSVESWFLSRTEARLYAAAALIFHAR